MKTRDRKIIFKNKILIIKSKFLCKKFGKFLTGESFGAITIFPFIIVKDNIILNDENYIRHESIHIYQYLETFIIGFWFIYLFEYLYAKFYLKKKGIDLYYYISLEQEAHQNDHDIDYLKKRKIFFSYKYLLDKNKKKISYDYKTSTRNVYNEKLI